MQKKIIYFLTPFIVYFTYFYTKPFDTNFHSPTQNEIEYIQLEKDVELSKSKLIIYKDGEINLDFFVQNKKGIPATLKIQINAENIKNIELENAKHTLYKIKVNRGDYIRLDILKTLFNKDDHVDLHLAMREYYQYYEELLFVFFWISLLMLALKKSFFISTVSVYTAYLLMLYSEQIAFGKIMLQTNFAILMLSLLLLYLTMLLRKLVKNNIFRIISVFILFLLVLFPYILSDIYCSSTSSTLSKQTIDALLQTNVHESLEYIEDFIDLPLAVSFALFLVLLVYFIVKSSKEHYSFRGLDYISLLVLLMYLSFQFQYLHLYALFINTLNRYTNEQLKYIKLSQNRKADIKNINVKKSGQGETYIVVIGESENKHHMSLYGYFRNTTPQLKKNKNIIRYTNAFSCQVYTTGVLSKALTESNQLNTIDYFHAYSIVELANKAGFQTYWLTNQVLKGAWDNVISAVAQESDEVVGLNKGVGRTVNTTEFDESLVPYLRKILAKKTDKNRIVFIHLMGNHNRYQDRYPKKFKKYDNYLLKEEFGNIVKKSDITNRINTYDNSVLYNDYVLNEIITEFSKAHSNGALLYFSDHSEDVENNLAHNPNKFTYAMTEIPLFVYVSDSYIKRYPNKYKNLVNNKNKLFNNAFIYDSLIGTTGIETEKFERIHDISSSIYKLDENESYTLGEKKLYASSDNKAYIKRKNIVYAKQRKIPLSVRNIQSFAQLYEAYYYGINNFTVTITEINKQLFVTYNGESIFLLEDLLNFINKNKIKLVVNININRISNINDSVQKIVQMYGKFVKFYLNEKQVKKLKVNKEIKKYIGLKVDSQGIYNAIIAFDKDYLDKEAKKYTSLLKQLKIQSLAFNQNIMQFIKTYHLDMYTRKALIQTDGNICNESFRIKIADKLSFEKVFYEINYCTIYNR